MEISLVKDIFLVIIGAFSTFFFTLLVLKIQKKKANITWRKLSNIHIPANNLTGIKWIVENQGNKSAKEISIQLKLKEGQRFETIDCKPSENALSFSQELNTESNNVIIKIPLFPNGISLDISSLVKDFNDKIEISIVGEDIIGKEHQVSDKAESYRKLANYMIPGIIGIYVVGMLAMFTFIGMLLNSRVEYEQTRSIANLYLSNGDNNEAIKLYETYSNNNIFLKETPSLLFEVLLIHAKSGEKEKLFSYIEKLSEDIKKDSAKKYIRFLETSAAFDQYRNDTGFKKVINKFKENNR
ncbi:hypothetical protein JWG39_15705 [Desulforhopalus vacuolatus]|uniref:hypothetical protein n=1 Tax=Desulforhopalus vacuolatus TaxID=40414 RepID=UPI0019645C72|nr:hypothetical protein [Desulforhopalus vacuolatus]MBM9521265.1 hypothetical protein [Desulforhopalus vacuolatus]